MGFERKGAGWADGGKPVFVLTHLTLSRTRESVGFCPGDLVPFVNERLRRTFRIFDGVDRDVALHLAEVKADRNGMVGLCCQVRGRHQPGMGASAAR